MTARRARPPVAAVADHRAIKIQMSYVDINSIQPYDYNPRDNEAAIQSVANSISTFGFLIPVVVDSTGVLAAGHTRVEAAKLLGMSEVPSILADHLSDQQINAFRLIDNKVAEISKWDFDMLSGEIAKLGETGIQLTDFGWSREELDCLSQMVADDCLSVDGLVSMEAEDRLRRTERRAPATARFVLGELVFFLPATEYRTWVDGLRTLHDYNEQDILEDIKRRLGITGAQ
jgi:ParB-like chromosome segregation protein Spo0J